jgi:hypothetical protein
VVSKSQIIFCPLLCKSCTNTIRHHGPRPSRSCSTCPLHCLDLRSSIMNFHHTFFDQKLPSGKSAAAGRQGPSRTSVYAVVRDRAAAEVFVSRRGTGLCILQRLIWGGRDRRRLNQLRASGDGNVREGGSRGKRPVAREVRGREGDMASYRGSVNMTSEGCGIASRLARDVG